MHEQHRQPTDFDRGWAAFFKGAAKDRGNTNQWRKGWLAASEYAYQTIIEERREEQYLRQLMTRG